MTDEEALAWAMELDATERVPNEPGVRTLARMLIRERSRSERWKALALTRTWGLNMPSSTAKDPYEDQFIYVPVGQPVPPDNDAA